MEIKKPLALKVYDTDNVATLFSNEGKAGCEVEIRDKKGESHSLCLKNDIPYGHKIALCTITAGSDIIKYGESLGEATKDIGPGEHVHVHNLDSKRGRGDKEA